MKTKNFSKTGSKIRAAISSSLILGMVLSMGVLPIAHAAAISSASDTLSSQKISTASNHDIVFTSPSGVDADETIIITFDSDFSIAGALDYTDIDVLDDGVDVTLAASPSGSTWGAVRTSGTVITLTNGDTAVDGGSVIRIKIGTNATNQSTGVRQITNASDNISYAVSMTGTFGDTGSITLTMLDDDQVAVSATVAQALTFTINDNSIGFGPLSVLAPRYATADEAGSGSTAVAHTLIVGTNATNGYTMTVNGTTLTSGGHTITAIGSSNTASSFGTEQFGLRMSASGGAGAVIAPYAAGGFALDTAAFPDVVASSGTSSADTTYSVRYLANIASDTEPGTYTTALTYVTTANF